jgi:hypothetical protein
MKAARFHFQWSYEYEDGTVKSLRETRAARAEHVTL